MKKTLFFLLLLLSGYNSYAQHLVVEGDVDVKDNKINNLADPIAPQDAATKAYVDNMLVSFGISLIGIQGMLDAGYCPLDILKICASKDSLYGKMYQGGLIFYLDDQDTIAGLKGLVCAPTDQSTGSEWGCRGVDLPDVPNVVSLPPTGLGAEIGDGLKNTAAILSSGNCPSAPPAIACTTYVGGGYNDWVLPSAKELKLMWENLADSDGNGENTGPDDPHNLGSFESEVYWTSTEFAQHAAFYRYFYITYQFYNFKNNTFHVRAVRAF